jgi:hypothetical protein
MFLPVACAGLSAEVLSKAEASGLIKNRRLNKHEVAQMISDNYRQFVLFVIA